MDLISFLSYAIIVVGLIVIFRSFDERPSQYFTIACIAAAALLLFGRHDLIPFPSSWNIEVLFPASICVMGLIVLVRVQDRSFPLLMVCLAGIQVLVATKVIETLH